MTTMTHAARAVSHTARATHAMETGMSGSEARAVTSTSCCSHSTTVSPASVSSASPMNATAFAVNGLRVLRM